MEESSEDLFKKSWRDLKKSQEARFLLAIWFFSAGMFLFIRLNVMLMLGGYDGLIDYLPVFVSVIIMIGCTVAILYPTDFKLQYVISAAVCLVAMMVISIVYFTFIPQMKELAESYSGSESGISGLQPGNVNFMFIDTLFIALILFFIVATIISIYLYSRKHLAKNETILEAKYL